MSDLELGLKAEIEFIAEENGMKINDKQMKKIIKNLLNNDNLWEFVNDVIEDEIYNVL